MAKVVGLVGSASGKLGNVVYAVTNGIQVARVYQPVVSNPKSALQMRQRAKGNLAGRVSGFVPKTAIMGLGKNNRSRRGEFLGNLLRAATVTESAGKYNAKIDGDELVFSRGTVNLSVYNPTITAIANQLEITLTGVGETVLPSTEYASMQTRIVVMVYDATTFELVECITKIATKPGQAATATTIMHVSHSTGYIADVYVVPMSSADGSAVSVSTDMATLSDDQIAALLSVNSNAVIFNYGKSILLGQGTYTPAP